AGYSARMIATAWRQWAISRACCGRWANATRPIGCSSRSRTRSADCMATMTGQAAPPSRRCKRCKKTPGFRRRGTGMRNGIAGLDHVIIAVRDLERARMGWTRLGFNLTPRGRHLGQGTANYCIMFGRDYLELLGFVTRDDYAHRLEAFLARREGAMSVAFAPAGSAEEAAVAL